MARRNRFCFILAIFIVKIIAAQPVSVCPTPPAGTYTDSAHFDFTARQFTFLYQGTDGSILYNYSVSSGAMLSSLTCTVNGAYTFTPSNGGGLSMMAGSTEIYPWTSGVVYTLTSADSLKDTLTLHWRMKYGATTMDFTYRLFLKGRTLVLAADAPGGASTGFYLDRCENAANPVVVPVPYLTLFNVLFTQGVFATMFFDWENTRATSLIPVEGSFSAASVMFAQNALYEKNTQGTVRPLHETVFLTVSPSFADVLPNLPNPVSPFKAASANRLVLDSWTAPFSKVKTMLQGLYSLGVRDLWFILHVWQNGGYDNKYPNVLPANPAFGGDTALVSLGVIDSAYGYLFGLHENYVDFYPNASLWNAADIARDRNDSLVKAWFNQSTGIQSYLMKPSRSSYYCNSFAPNIHRTYKTTASFLDVHSAVNPSFCIDYDANTPNSAMFIETLARYRDLAGLLRTLHNGPVSGEGNNHFLSVGYFDDIEAQLNTGKSGGYWSGERLPVFPDFKLNKMHVKAAMHGVGYYERFFSDSTGASVSSALPLDTALIYMATELAYGNCGFIPTMEMSANQSELARREYTYILPVQKRYANAAAQSITYNDNGAEVDASEYIRRHPATFADCKSADFMSQIKITYDNGVVVCVNRHPTRSYSVSAGSAGGWFSAHTRVNSKDSLWAGISNTTQYLLPPENGWVAYLPQQTKAKEPRSFLPQKNALHVASHSLPSGKITIYFILSADGRATIDIHDISGKLIATPIEGFQTAGNKTISLNAADNNGRNLPSGMYICTLKAQSTTTIKTFLFLK